MELGSFSHLSIVCRIDLLRISIECAEIKRRRRQDDMLSFAFVLKRKFFESFRTLLGAGMPALLSFMVDSIN